MWRGDQLVSSACLACAAPIVIEISVMKKTYDPDSIRVPGFDPEFRVPGLVFVVFPGSLSESPCTRRGHRILDPTAPLPTSPSRIGPGAMPPKRAAYAAGKGKGKGKGKGNGPVRL